VGINPWLSTDPNTDAAWVVGEATSKDHTLPADIEKAMGRVVQGDQERGRTRLDAAQGGV